MPDIPNVPYEYQESVASSRDKERMRNDAIKEILKSKTLNASEHESLRRIYKRYDLKTNIGGKGLYSNDLPQQDINNLPRLESVGGIRIEPDGRIIPSFIIQEGGRPIYRPAKSSEHFPIQIGNKRFKV